MKRKLKKSEKNALYTAAVIVVLICLWLAWINPVRDDIVSLSKKIEKEEIYLKDVGNLKQEYLTLEYRIREYREIISRRPENFSLKKYITNVESELNFPNRRQSGESIRKLGTEYIRTKIDYSYRGKSLEQIKNYLYKIEDPLNAIIIDSILLKPDTATGKKFDIDIRLSVVTVAKE